MLDIIDEITLELARLQRAALARVRQRNAEQQLGEAWVDLPNGNSGEVCASPLIFPPTLFS